MKHPVFTSENNFEMVIKFCLLFINNLPAVDDVLHTHCPDTGLSTHEGNFDTIVCVRAVELGLFFGKKVTKEKPELLGMKTLITANIFGMTVLRSPMEPV